MKYYQWLGNITGVEFPDLHFNEEWWMVEGRPVVGWNENLEGKYNPDRVELQFQEPSFDFGLALNGWPISSQRMRQFLEKIAPGLVQFLPFRLLTTEKRVALHGYCVAQVLRLVDCLDRRKTQVRNNWKPINEYGDFGIRWPIVLDENLIGDERLFRIKGDCGRIVIRDDLKKAIEDAGFLEQRFDPLKTT